MTDKPLRTDSAHDDERPPVRTGMREPRGVGPPKKTFQAVRDRVGVGAELASRERPIFHDIRSVDARTYRAKGFSKEHVQHPRKS